MNPTSDNQTFDSTWPAFGPDHITALYAEYASDREIPADWPSEIVRRAAKLMKERAYAATVGPWVSLDNGDRLLHDPGHDMDKPIYVVDEPMSNAANAEHIAAVSAAVQSALLVLRETAGAR